MPRPGLGFPTPPFEWPYVGSQWPPYNIESDQAEGLVAWWPTLASRGATMLQDLAGHGYHGAFKGPGEPAWVFDAERGFVLDFDGVDDQVSVLSNLGLGAIDITIFFRVYVPTTSEQGAFINIGDVGIAGDGFGIGVGDAASFENTGNVGNNLALLYNGLRWIPTGTNIGTGWHDIAVTLDANGYPEAFLDGISVYSDSTGAPATPLDDYFYIGGYVTGIYDRHPDCLIDDIRAYNRRPPNAEIWQLHDPSTRWELHQLPRHLWRLGAIAPPPPTIIPVVMHHYRSMRL